MIRQFFQSCSAKVTSEVVRTLNCSATTQIGINEFPYWLPLLFSK